VGRIGNGKRPSRQRSSDARFGESTKIVLGGCSAASISTCFYTLEEQRA
jgi:hypothetical protein